MRPVLVSYATDHAQAARLRNSATRLGWRVEIAYESEWRGLGRKFKGLVEAGRSATARGSTHAVCVDGYDVIALGGPDEFADAMEPFADAAVVFAAEKACFPDGSLAPRYPTTTNPWRFLNAQFVVRAGEFDRLAAERCRDDEDDQLFLTRRFLDAGVGVLDYDGRVVQTVAHCHPWRDWFGVAGGRVVNKLTGSRPLFVHGNGRTDLSWVP